MIAAHSWSTAKQADGFVWKVMALRDRQPSVVLRTGKCRTRAQATLWAKKWVLYFRRGGLAMPA